MEIGGVNVPDAVVKAVVGQNCNIKLPGFGSVARMKDDEGFEHPPLRKTVTIGDAIAMAKKVTGESQKGRKGSRFEVLGTKMATALKLRSRS